MSNLLAALALMITVEEGLALNLKHVESLSTFILEHIFIFYLSFDTDCTYLILLFEYPASCVWHI